MNGKKGLIGALVALVAVVAIAGVAYGVLAPKANEQTANTSADASQGGQSESNDTESVNTNENLPILSDFTVLDLEGNQVTLSGMRDKPTFVGYWATWCPPCNEEAPGIQKLFEQYGDRVNFMMVDLTDGTRETVEAAKAWRDERGYTYPIYFDTTMDAAQAGQVQYIPTTYLIDTNGETVFYSSGVVTEEMGSQLLESVLQ